MAPHLAAADPTHPIISGFAQPYCDSCAFLAPGGWAAFINSPDTLAQAVSQAPALVTLDATDWALYAGGILDCDTPGKTMNHAVAVVGYVNGVTQPNGELWDFFIVRNSFGSWWGGGNGPYAGHMLIRKGCNVTAESTGGPSGLHVMEGSVPLYG